MQFKIGDLVWYNWIGEIRQAAVTGVFPNTNRYRIKDSWERLEKASILFGSRREYFEAQFKRVESHIIALEKEKKEILKELE